MNRRSFLGAMFAACAAPAIVRADSLMRIVPMHTLIDVTEADIERIMHTLWGDGIHDDTLALQAALDGKSVVYNSNCNVEMKNGVLYLAGGTYLTSKPFDMSRSLRGISSANPFTARPILRAQSIPPDA